MPVGCYSIIMTGEYPSIFPRRYPEQTASLFSFDGDARQCGRHYAEQVRRLYPDYTRYLQQAHTQWGTIDRPTLRLYEKHAPHIPELFAGILEVSGTLDLGQTHTPDPDRSCTSFSVHPDHTLDGVPISGQTKDTVPESIPLYIVLRMRIDNAPTILVLAYPGEVLGYGMWSTGMTVMRNNIHSDGPSEKGLAMEHYGLLALAQDSLDKAIELAMQHGIIGVGCLLFSDASGNSACVEFNDGGVNIIQSNDGIMTHANHPVGPETSVHEHYPDPEECRDSRFRMERLHELLDVEKGRLTAQKTLATLTDHQSYPRGICRHLSTASKPECTTAAVIAESTKGRLHVTTGPPCANWSTTYTL